MNKECYSKADKPTIQGASFLDHDSNQVQVNWKHIKGHVNKVESSLLTTKPLTMISMTRTSLEEMIGTFSAKQRKKENKGGEKKGSWTASNREPCSLQAMGRCERNQ